MAAQESMDSVALTAGDAPAAGSGAAAARGAASAGAAADQLAAIAPGAAPVFAIDSADDDALSLPLSRQLAQQASQQEARGAGAGSAAADAAAGGPPRPLQSSFESLKSGGLRLAGMLKATAEKTAEVVGTATAPVLASASAAAAAAAAAGAAVVGSGGSSSAPQAPGDAGGLAFEADEPTARGAAANGGSPAAGAAVARIKATATGLTAVSSRLAHAASDGLKRIAAGDPLLTICRAEPSVPQLVLACCSALVAGPGVRTPGIFAEPGPEAELERLKHCVVGGRPCLIPPGTSPHTVAAMLKRFLTGLPEPLLTYRLLPDWVAASADPDKAAALMQQLPAANSNVLRLLLEVCHWVNHYAADTEMDSLALAQALAPCVAWLPPRPRSGGATTTGGDSVAAANGGGGDAAAAAAAGGSGVTLLEGEEAEAVVHLLEGLISRFAIMYG